MDFRKKSNKEAKDKAWMQQQGIFSNPYAEDTKEPRKSYLIICEGKNTEYYYFTAFPEASNMAVVERDKNSKTSLVDYAIKRCKEDQFDGYETWCVFDMDIKPDEGATQPEDFNNAILKAEAAGLKVAWSNDSFELWFLLHFRYLEAALTRHEIYPKIREAWEQQGFVIESSRDLKGVEFCKDHYARHKDLLGTAIKNARRLHQSYGSRTDYAAQCPCTTVYLLVEELLENLERG